MKKNYIAIAIAIATAAMLSGTVIAHQLPPNVAHTDVPDVSGDSLINLPKHGSTVPSKSVDVWFVQIPDATSYSLDLVGAGFEGQGGIAFAGVCGTVTTAGGDAANRTMELRRVIDLADLQCGNETSETLTGDGDVRSLSLCHYTLPDLANGNYALAINPILVGSGGVLGSGLRSQQEIRNDVTCGSAVSARDPLTTAAGVSSASADGNDTLGYVLNTISNRVVDTGTIPNGLGVNNLNTSVAGATPGSPLSADTFYQRFTVLDASPVPTQAPSQSRADHPVQLATLFSNLNLLEWSDPSGSAGAADWYEIWIYDKDGVRIEGSAKFVNDNLSYPQWYKSVVNPALSCQSNIGQGTSRICTVDLNSVVAAVPAGAGDPLEPGIDAAFTAANVNDVFKWYVRGYNQFGAGPWSAGGEFRKN